VFIGEILPNMTQVSDVAPGPLVLFMFSDIHLIFRICFDISRYRSSSSLVLIYWFFRKLWLLDVEKYHKFSVFRTFLFMLSDIHLIFGILLWHIKIQIKVEFGFDPLTFHEVTWPLDLEKYYKISVFCTFVVPRTGFAVSDNYKSKFSFVYAWFIFDWSIPSVGDLVWLAILSECLFFFVLLFCIK
jgi:hypothetical protein